ncbi:hypothetical protein ACSBL2_11335 [Pedobacter sp. AW31-3R]|uniref:hypothetical protein n=1 Tax=Pedobacter sp. AW31-3R TaxID=3445781 RepID=UPI003FA0C01C
MGHPVTIDEPLAQIVAGKWDIAKRALEVEEEKRLKKIDGSIIPQFNAYLPQKQYTSALAAIDSLLKKEPALKYAYYTGHYTFLSLLNTDPEKAVTYAREAWAANAIPNWKSVSDAIYTANKREVKLPAPAYLLGVEALQAQLDNYPWSMNFPETYKEIAGLYLKAGNQEKYKAFMKLSVSTTNQKK